MKAAVTIRSYMPRSTLYAPRPRPLPVDDLAKIVNGDPAQNTITLGSSSARPSMSLNSSSGGSLSVRTKTFLGAVSGTRSKKVCTVPGNAPECLGHLLRSGPYCCLPLPAPYDHEDPNNEKNDYDNCSQPDHFCPTGISIRP